MIFGDGGRLLAAKFLPQERLNVLDNNTGVWKGAMQQKRLVVGPTMCHLQATFCQGALRLSSDAKMEDDWPLVCHTCTVTFFGTSITSEIGTILVEVNISVPHEARCSLEPLEFPLVFTRGSCTLQLSYENHFCNFWIDRMISAESYLNISHINLSAIGKSLPLQPLLSAPPISVPWHAKGLVAHDHIAIIVQDRNFSLSSLCIHLQS